jgi:DNA-binding MarR family transcriptional regulator
VTAATSPAAATQQVSQLRMAVMRLSRRLRHQGNVGITPSQLAVLGTLARNGAMTLGQLAEAEAVQPPSMTRIVGGLVDAGMVVRQARAEDRRSAEVTLSAPGRRAVESIRAHRNTWLMERLQVLTDSEKQDLWRGVAAIERLLEGPR